MMDYFFGGFLLMGPDPNKEYSRAEKIDLAREESRRIPRLLGALRYLWRNGFWGLAYNRFVFFFWAFLSHSFTTKHLYVIHPTTIGKSYVP